MERITSSNAFETWGKQYKSVQRWMTKIQKKDMASFDLYRFCQWARKDPDELLALKADPRSLEAEKLLDDFKLNEAYTLSVRLRILINVKSFYKGNYIRIAPGAGVVEDYVKEKPYHKLTKDDLRKIWRLCYNPRDRVILDLTFGGGIAIESLTHLTWGHIEDGWENQRIIHVSLEPEIIKGHGRGRYKGVRQETFITPSGKIDLTEYKAWIEEKIGRPVTKEDPLLFTIQEPYVGMSYSRISNVFADLSKRSKGIEITPHDGRRYVENALENANIHINRCRKIRGRKVRGEEAPYSQPAIEELRADYAKALDNLEFQIEKPAIKPEDIRKEILNTLPDEEIKPIADKYGISIAEARHMVILRESAFKELWSERRKRIQTEPNGGSINCQKIVAEDKLEEHLLDGWQVKAVLPSGRVVISKG